MKSIEEKAINKHFTYYIDNKPSPIILISASKNSTDSRFSLIIESDPITEFDHYLNIDLQDKSFDTRRKHAHAIYLFYTFVLYSECDINELSENDIHNLVYFLAGKDDKLDNATLITKRNVNSVANHLSIIRNYLYSLNIKNNYLGFPTSKISIKQITNFIKQELDGSIRYGQASNEIVSPEEFEKLLSTAKQHNDLTTQTIIIMLYEYGFRLGEILGITLEDISSIQNTPDTIENFITLRDRASDESYQRSKRLFSVAGKANTNSTNYSEIHVPIDNALYRQLIKYIDWSANKRDYDYCYADNLTKKYDHNYYIFISKRGHSLSDQMLNERLRSYFDQASINTDSKSSRKNLSGKLRRSYIIRRVSELREEGLSDYRIKKILAFELRYTDTYYLDSFMRKKD